MTRPVAKVPLANPEEFSRYEVRHVYQLEPEPPKLERLNDCIISAVGEQNPDHFLFFLHFYEPILNNRVCGFLANDRSLRMSQERILYYKQAVVTAMFEKLWSYNPGSGAEFLTYVHHDIEDAMIRCRMREESFGFSGLDEYKRVRRLAGMRTGASRTDEEIAKSYAEQSGCSEKTAMEYLRTGRGIRARIPLYPDENGDPSADDKDSNWSFEEYIWDGIEAAAVRKTFAKLSYREQRLLEERNAVCMTCGRVSPLKCRKSFEELAVLFELGSANSAEVAYQRAVEKLKGLLIEDGVVGNE